MRLQALSLLLIPLFTLGTIAIPVAEPGPEPVVENGSSASSPLLKERGCPRKGQGGGNTGTNVCASGEPYCCNNQGGRGHVCIKSQTQCNSQAICCNNFNGMQICAGEIDFTGPVTININL